MRIQPSMLARQHAGSGGDEEYVPARGGDLARLVFPAVVADNPKYNTECQGRRKHGAGCRRH